MTRFLRWACVTVFVISGALVGLSGTAMAIEPAPGHPLRGVNLAGLEFGEGNIPGVYDKDYTSPTNPELDYFNSAGLKVIRLPFRWERVQPKLNEPLDPTNLGRLDAVIAEAGNRGQKVLLDPHNFGRYKINGVEYVIGSPQVPREAFNDFWRQLAVHYAGNPAIYVYGLMNEPHDMGVYDWKTTAQGAVDAIRAVDVVNTIAVPGDGWSGAWNWDKYNANLIISDTTKNIVYEAHQYFDRDGSGTYRAGYGRAYPTIGVDRLQPFLDWLKANSAKGFIGEFGVPDNDARWLEVMDNFLSALDNEGMDAIYWAAGPWWGDYPLSIDPSKSSNPQLQVLMNHLGLTPNPIAPPTWPGFTITSTSVPRSGAVGNPVALDLSLASDKNSAAVLVDLEISDSVGKQVWQQTFSDQSFTAGQPNTYTPTFAPAASGVYTVKVGVFGPGWEPLYDWFNSVATIRVR